MAQRILPGQIVDGILFPVDGNVLPVGLEFSFPQLISVSILCF